MIQTGEIEGKVCSRDGAEILCLKLPGLQGGGPAPGEDKCGSSTCHKQGGVCKSLPAINERFGLCGSLLCHI